MNIFSDFRKDAARSEDPTGGYEWWYFDATSADEKLSFVVIFYRGNPFSRRYISRLSADGVNARPSAFPAISISIYEDANPIYYSFTEFKQSDCLFDEERPFVEIGPHTMEARHTSGSLQYQLSLEETLASGDQLEASFTFTGPSPSESLFANVDNLQSGGHAWNLVQPRTEVEGAIHISGPTIKTRELAFEGTGYHDHNTGDEPMHDEFADWYWGRFHFDFATLVYYVMNRQNAKQHQAWLISKDSAGLLQIFDQIDLTDNGFTLFGLQPYRKIGLRSDEAEIQVQHRQVVDNGPFYQRYHSDAFLRIPDLNIVEQQQGISEYIYPDRINARAFWPFVDMRIRYKTEKPHWVQRSPRLYRWTW